MQLDLFHTDARTADFDRRRIYRYTLWRRWSDGPRYVNFICINPSTADENTDDPTVRKCIKFARSWGREGAFNNRASIVRTLLSRFDLHYLRITQCQPWHPLYLPDNTRPSRWPRSIR